MDVAGKLAYLVPLGGGVGTRAARLDLGGSLLGHVVPVAPERQHVVRALDEAADSGVSVVGLDPRIAAVSAGGAALRHRADVAVTNGAAYTAAVLHDQVRDVLEVTGGGRVAIVGAAQAVGTTLAKLLVRRRDADHVLLLDPDRHRLDSLACNLAGRGVGVRAGSGLGAVRDADLVVVLAETDPVLAPEHLDPTAVVLDATPSGAGSGALRRDRPDVRVAMGGLVSLRSIVFAGAKRSRGRAPAGLAEAALLTLDGRRGHFSIGVPDLDQVEQVRVLAGRYASLGFTPDPPAWAGAGVRGVEPQCAVA